MNRIRLLPEQVANQIAAGEVVERPASVVKELVENALDANATSIILEIQAGGRSLIRVTDDGRGMSKDDALLCLERHATSKIQKAEDLASIETMGFRGEALPSIASVSRFTLTTREREDASIEATQIVISGGKILEVKTAGSPPGTTVEVRQLFFNLPARRKFLRSEETEAAHIQHYLTLAALGRPDVGFIFRRDGKIISQLPPVKTSDRLQDIRQRLRVLQGEEAMISLQAGGKLATTANHLEGAWDDTEPPRNELLSLWGWIGAPGVSRGNRDDQNIFVNRRPIENRGLNFALQEGYHTSLMKGRYPVCCLFLELDPGEVDVNIHPSKREIKFHREREVRDFVTRAIRDALLHFHSTAAPPAPSIPVTPAQRSETSPAIGVTRSVQTRDKVAVPAPPPSIPLEKLWREATRVSPIASRLTNAPASRSLPLEREFPAGNSSPQPLPPRMEPVPLLNVPLRVVGVVGRLYVVLESDRGLVLLDQHAAHERILYEQMVRRLEEESQAPSQRLLLPETVEVSARDAQFLRDQLPILTRLGVGLTEFGERTFLLDGLPPFVRASAPRKFVLELIDELKATGDHVSSVRLGEETIVKTVCRHAVKANDPLAGPELENLVEDLRSCQMPYTCPHGRPTLIEMNFRELEKKFGRQQ